MDKVLDIADLATAAARCPLGPIAGATHVVRDLDYTVDAYAAGLGLGLVDRGRVTSALAAGWGAPRAAGSRYALLAAGRGAGWLRFVERPEAAAVPALTSWGWNATEIVVADPDALVGGMTAAGFTLIGPPASLSRFPMIRAAQLLGPDGECVYVTRTGSGHGLDLPVADAPVGRVYIVVAGGPDLDAMLAAYARLGNGFDPPVETPVRVLSRANGLAVDTLHAHALVALGEGTHVELDRYPATCGARPVPPGDLPPGMAIVTFAHGPVGGPRHPTPTPDGERAACLLRGAAGELIEVIAP